MIEINYIEGMHEINFEGLEGSLFFSSKPRINKLSYFIEKFKNNNVKTITVLMTKEEMFKHYDFNLLELYKNNGLEIIHYPIKDYGVPPDIEGFDDIVDKIRNCLSENKNVLVHCSGGIGRSGLVVSGVAVKELDQPPQQILDMIRREKFVVETDEQEEFLLEYYRYLHI